ncbi:MAG: S-layer homology domain-containing protein [Clostridia bacterium]|nr:S-layer homology domain-containing protein [Clostridia bacterium]
MNKTIKRLSAVVLAGCMVCGMVVGASAATSAAMIGSTSYPTLNAALRSVKNGETIVLQRDISNEKEVYSVGTGKGAAYFASESAAKEFTIDLNKHTITAGTESQTGLLIAADSKAGNLSITLKNGTISASGTNVTGMEIRDNNEVTPTTVTLDNVTVEADGEAGINCISSNLVIASANVTGKGDAVYAENSLMKVYAGAFTANGSGTGDGAIAVYTGVSEDALNLDLSKVSDSEAMCVRPADWKKNMTSKVTFYYFNDISENTFYYKPVLWAVKNGVTAGTSVTTFSPKTNCTRAQIATFLWNEAGQPKPTISKCPFTDIKAGSWYYDAVLWAYEKNITAGTSATKFSPNEECTRAQIATFLWNKAGQPKPTISKNPFTDVKAGTWYYNAVLWAAEKGITAGTSANTFSPNKICTRGEIVTFLYNANK